MKLLLPYVIVLNDGALTFIFRKLCPVSLIGLIMHWWWPAACKFGANIYIHLTYLYFDLTFISTQSSYQQL